MSKNRLITAVPAVIMILLTAATGCINGVGPTVTGSGACSWPATRRIRETPSPAGGS